MKHRTHLHIPTAAPAEPVLLRCPSCQEETLALAGSLCERCNPENTAIVPAHEPRQARCHACRAVVTTATLRQSPDLEQVTLMECPHCGILWGSTNPYRAASGGVVWERHPQDAKEAAS
jgi:hypothetical protein